MEDIREMIQSNHGFHGEFHKKLLPQQYSHLYKMFLIPPTPSLLILFATDSSDMP